MLAAGGGRDDYLRRLPASLLASADMAHATHPNYPECHEPSYLIEVNAGPRYSRCTRICGMPPTGAQQRRSRWPASQPGSDCSVTSIALTDRVVRRSGRWLPLDWYSHVGVGAAQLAMHSAGELMGAHDVAVYAAALQAFSADLF